METVVYADVLLVLNYIINMLLVLCMCKMGGRAPKRRRIVAAALIGSASSLTIFLPYMGVLPSLLGKLAVSMLMVLAANPYRSFRLFLRELLLLFAAAFFFAGTMLALRLGFAPKGMFYHNGVVYFDVSSAVLVLAAVAAYLALSLFHRAGRAGRLRPEIWRAEIRRGGKAAEVTGLVDTGNSLCEPFSGTPVMVCSLESLLPVLPDGLAEKMRAGQFPDSAGLGGALRLIPYENIGGAGVIPAFRPDEVRLEREGCRITVEDVYVGISRQPVGDGRYDAILNPDLAGLPPGKRREAAAK